jgi:phosphatidylethanolamine/phosphatidyl-N-methylethanolamine N-methyltransferase
MKPLLLFLREAFKKQLQIGAVAPSSKASAQAMVVPLSHRTGPVRVLEIGPGTGALTDTILEQLGPGDHLDLCELNPQFAGWLRERFAAPNPKGPTVRVLEGDALTVASGPYDFVLSSVPTTNLPLDVSKRFLEGLIGLLTPEGVATCLHYRGLRMRTKVSFGKERERLTKVLDLHIKFHAKHGLAKRIVWMNMPPAEVHYICQDPRTANRGFLDSMRDRRTAVNGEHAEYDWK